MLLAEPSVPRCHLRRCRLSLPRSSADCQYLIVASFAHSLRSKGLIPQRRCGKAISMSHTTTVEYGRKLINAGVTGLRNGHRDFDAERANALLVRSAEESLG